MDNLTFIYFSMMPIIAIINYGLMFAYLQGRFSIIAEEVYEANRSFCMIQGFIWSILNILGVIIVYFLFTERGKYGFKWK